MPAPYVSAQGSKRVKRGLHNIVSEAILLSVSLTWLLLFTQFINGFPTPASTNFAGLELFSCIDGSFYLRVIETGVIDDASPGTEILLYNSTLDQFLNVTLPLYVKNGDILLLKSFDNVNAPWLRTGDLFYFINKHECSLILLPTS